MATPKAKPKPKPRRKRNADSAAASQRTPALSPGDAGAEAEQDVRPVARRIVDVALPVVRGRHGSAQQAVRFTDLLAQVAPSTWPSAAELATLAGKLERSKEDAGAAPSPEFESDEEQRLLRRASLAAPVPGGLDVDTQRRLRKLEWLAQAPVWEVEGAWPCRARAHAQRVGTHERATCILRCCLALPCICARMQARGHVTPPPPTLTPPRTRNPVPPSTARLAARSGGGTRGGIRLACR